MIENNGNVWDAKKKDGDEVEEEVIEGGQAGDREFNSGKD